MDSASLTLATWNLQGSRGIDATECARRLLELAGPGGLDVAVIQEIGRRQSRQLAGALGLGHRTWGFKHWPVAHGAEGLAVLSRIPFVSTRRLVLHRAPWWSWRRRIALLAALGAAEAPLALVADVHLSPHALSKQRLAEIAQIVAVTGERPTFVVGDMNDQPGSEVFAALREAGWRDGWAEVHGDRPGPTNWTDDAPRFGRAPTQRLDAIFVPGGWTIEWITVPDGDPRGFDEWATLSDHLPVIARVTRADQI